MTIKWATAVYRTLLLPSFAVHFRYFQRKAALDRVLEKFHPMANIGLGVMFGAIFYLVITPLRPHRVDKSLRQLQLDLVDALSAMHVDFRQEFYPFAVQRIRSEVVSRALVARDEAEARKELQGVEQLKQQLQASTAELKAKKLLDAAALAPKSTPA